MYVPVTLSHSPFSKPTLRFAVEGKTIYAMLMDMRDQLPPGFARDGVVMINDQIVPRKMWRFVRPRVRHDCEIIVHVMIRLQGGGGGQGGGQKNTLATVAMIAVLVAATVVSAGALGPAGLGLLGAGFASGTIGASLLGAAIGIGGSLAISALTPPPSTEAVAAPKPGVPALSTQASLNGNVLSPGAPIPRVLGTHKIYPPFAAQPLIDVVEGDEVIEANYVLAGPHKIEDVRLNDIPLADIQDTEIETFEGWDSDTAPTLITRYGKTENVGIQFSESIISDTNTNDYKDQVDPTNSFSESHLLRTPGIDGEEFWITISAPSGFSDLQTLAAPISVPVRITIRPVGVAGADWINLPEIHFTHFKAESFSKIVKLHWTTAPTLTAPPTSKAPVVAYTRVPMRNEGTNTNYGNDVAPREGTGPAGASTVTGTVTHGFFSANFFGSGGLARTFNRIEIWPDDTQGFANQDNITFEAVYSLNGASVVDPRTDGTVIASQIITNATTRTTPIIFDFAPIENVEMIWYRQFLTAGGTVVHRVAEVQFYGPTDSHPGDHYSWRAHSHFITNQNEFDSYMNAADFATTNVRNIQLSNDSVDVYLDPATFPVGVYDVKVLRGNPVRFANFDQNQYIVVTGTSGVQDNILTDFFGYVLRNAGGFKFSVLRDSAQFSAKMAINRISSVWNIPAVQTKGLAQVLIKTKRNGDSLSVIASGYVQKWNGADSFSDWGISSKPADHYFDVLTGTLNANPLPLALVNVASLVEWRSYPYECNMVVEGRSAFEVLNLLGGCGYARPWQSETWGVTIDHDRSRDTPVQMFSPRNMRNFKWAKAFPRLPDGFRVRFDDREQNYKEREIIILRPGAVDNGKYEDIRYEGLVTEQESTKRGLFDLRQAQLRPISYTGEVALEHIVATRGELVGVAYDVLSKLFGFSRVKSVTTSAGNVTALVLDGSVTLDPALAAQWGVAIRCNDGTQTVKEIVVPGVATDTFTLTFTTPFPDPGNIVEDCLVNIGELGQEQRPLVVFGVTPQAGLTGEIAFVDVANELFS